MADLINILRCTYKGPGEGFGAGVPIVSDLSKVPYSRIMMNGNDVTSEAENNGGWVQVSGSYFIVDFYLTGDTIGARAFRNNNTSISQLVGVNVPSIVKKLGSYTFAENTYLTDIILNEGLEDIGFNEAGEEYTGRTFEGISVANVVIPSTVRHIGQNSFYDWTEPYYILFMSETPPTIDDNGEGTLGHGTAKIFVPPGTTNAYKSAMRDWYWPYIEEFDPNITNKSIYNAYAGEDAVMEIYLGTNLIYSCATCNQIGLCGDVPNCYPCTCGDFYMCGDYPDCHECTCEEQYEEGTQELCECQGKYWYDDECHEPEDPCAECVSQDDSQECCECAGGTWEDDGEGNYSCVFPQDNCDWWDRNGYSSYEDCMCQNFGTDCEEEGCNGDPECECNEQGGTWDGENCNFE